jgi:AsmA protein
VSLLARPNSASLSGLDIDMKALKIAGAAIAAVIVVVALLAVIGIPSGYLTSAIKERVERETGYRLAINGATRIGIWPSLNVTLNDIALQDPKDREINNRLTAASVQADVTLASLWSGRPQVTELLIVRPVLNLPLQRVREVNPPPRATGARAANATIEHVSITGGTVVFSSLRDRVESRIETINADATIGSDRKIVVSGSARAAERPLKFEVKATAPPPPLERQNVPTEFVIDAPGLLQAPVSGQAELRLNGSVVMINGLSGTLGDGAFNGWASVDIASKPLVKLDLDFQRLTVATTAGRTGGASQPWSNASIELNGLNYVDAQAKISAAEIAIGDGRFAPAAIEATLANGVLRANLANLGAYGGNANGDLSIDASTANPSYALRADLTGVRALPLLKSVADFDKLDGRMQAKIGVRSSGNSQRAIMTNLSGTAFAVFQDGAIRGLNVAQMIRSLTASTLSGWQENEQQATDLSQLSASFKIDKGQAVTTDLNLIGPLVKMTGAGTIDLGTKQIGFRVEPKLVMTTEGQGRTGDPVGFGIPVMIEGPWDAPRIYPEMQGILDNPDTAYAKLREMGKGLFGPNGAGLGGLGGLINGGGQGGSTGQSAGGGQPGGANDQAGGLLGGQLGETIGNLLKQGLSSGLGQQGGAGAAGPSQGTGQGTSQGTGQGTSQGTSKGRSMSPAEPAPPAPSAPARADSAEPQDSQPMNEVLRQLFNR